MKTTRYILTILCLSIITAFGQSKVDWKTKKNATFTQTGISAEGHDARFSTQIFKDKNQFIELAGGSGIFSPNAKVNQTLSSGFTYNCGIKKHFFSVGIHMIYASNDVIALESFLKQEAYLSNARIGYHYSTKKLDFQLHVQPLSGISQRLTSLGSSASLSFRL